MDPSTVDRKLAAILSADVVGYSRLMADDETETVRTLAAYRDEMVLLVGQHRGRVVDFTGDNMLAEFPTATDAVSCAVEVQRILQVRNDALASERKMEFRIGVHLGEVRVEGERIYGNGVHVAARLEGLAESGGICISNLVYDQVRRLDLAYEDLGTQPLEGIPDPVHVFRVRWARHEGAPGETLSGMADLTVPGFSGRPAIAVLPFDNLSGDPEQEYFADGIAEDLITRLSDWRRFPVIARNSSFTYRGRAVDVKRVSLELGVRYVVEGSVRKAGDRVRIAAQLIDATTGQHIWAERYDRELRDVFALQDEISEAIVSAMHPELELFEVERAVRQQPRDLDAYELVFRGWWHFLKGGGTRDDFEKALTLFKRATERDPHLAIAFSALAQASYGALLHRWTESPAQTVVDLVRAAQTSVELDDKDPHGQIAASLACMVTGRQDEMLQALELAVRLNPSMSEAYLYQGAFLGLAGKPEQALTQLEKGMRLSPKDPMMWFFFYCVAQAHCVAERYEQAVDWAQRSRLQRPNFALTYRILATSYAHLGKLDEARAAVEEQLRLEPDISLAAIRMGIAAADPAFVERLLDGLRKAGLPEE